MVPKFLGCNRGTISIKRIIWDWTWQLTTLGSSLQARSSGTSYLSNTTLAQPHRSSLVASSWLNFFWTPKKKRKPKNNSNKLSAEPQGELANECDSVWRIRNMNWAGWWRTPSWLSMHLAGWFFSRSCFFRSSFFLVLLGTDGFSDAAFAVQTNPSID